jgi:hypothetical protein
MTSNILKFERRDTPKKAKHVAVSGLVKKTSFNLWQVFIKTIWVFTVLLWPILSWVIALDCLYQLIRMLYYWNTPVHAGWTFLIHFGVAIVLNIFVVTVPYDKK